jgi:TfoX/Sxy family transcriptional regulator of competence genes
MAAKKWKKAPEGLVQRFGEALPDDPEIERRLMFGYPCAFFRGHMFCGLFEDQFIVRLSDAERSVFLKQPGAKVFEPMPGRPMKEYVLVPQAVVERDALLGGWLRQALDYVAGLPPRAKKAKKAASARPAKKASKRPKAKVRAKTKPRSKTKARAKPKPRGNKKARAKKKR